MLGPLHCGLIAQALLLPKLRSHFAEFLDNASPVGLRILSSSTCVGLRYGHHENNSGFSCLPAHADSLLLVRSDSYGGFPPADLPTGRPPYLHRCFLHRPALTRSVPTVLFHGGTGISTCYPSTTPFGLALGPDLPRADQPCPGNLGYSAGRILTFLSLLIPAFSLLITPRLLIGNASSRSQCSPTDDKPSCDLLSPSFGGVF